MDNLDTKIKEAEEGEKKYKKREKIGELTMWAGCFLGFLGWILGGFDICPPRRLVESYQKSETPYVSDVLTTTGIGVGISAVAYQIYALEKNRRYRNRKEKLKSP